MYVLVPPRRTLSGLSFVPNLEYREHLGLLPINIKITLLSSLFDSKYMIRFQRIIFGSISLQKMARNKVNIGLFPDPFLGLKTYQEWGEFNGYFPHTSWPFSQQLFNPELGLAPMDPTLGIFDPEEQTLTVKRCLSKSRYPLWHQTITLVPWSAVVPLKKVVQLISPRGTHPDLNQTRLRRKTHIFSCLIIWNIRRGQADSRFNQVSKLCMIL